MITEDLVELTKWILQKKTETQTLEVKSARDGCPKRLYDTLSSFSNQDGGGVLFFGIDESQGFALVGVYDLHDLQKKVVEQCQQMEPPVRAVFTVAEVDGADVCAAEIPGLDLTERPCYYKGSGKGKGSYVRVGDSDFCMSDYELYSFEAFRRHLHDDERPLERADEQDLQLDMVEAYLREKQRERPRFAQLPEARAYELLNILHQGKPTLAALMNFGVYPQGFFPQLCITAVAVPGTEIGDTDEQNVRFLDNKRMEGTLADMLAEAIAFCRRNMRSRVAIDKRTGERRDFPEYPVAAIREAVLNALIHRDYSIHTEGTPIQLCMFSNRMEIHSPGSLYGRMTVEQLGKAKMDLRNPALAVMAETMTEAENRYSGIPTMYSEMKAFNLPAPLFENRRNEFVVTFFNGRQEATLRSEDELHPGAEISLTEFCRTPRTRREIADFLGLQTATYAWKRYIAPLLESGELQMTIPEKPKSSKQRYYACDEADAAK
ncbi:hypothetical protein TAMA11512_03120 [Selenomonas sp. TAMA-11512]|uniref:ATP-binding protein n=1 Tax=Selenomonas sp. TAMA-11512 TaxID=3095337 RepID=UPI0030855947|nr:hypothetical protein TAMA11512_03120 [Selenomonas sp. TAMA-11512]